VRGSRHDGGGRACCESLTTGLVTDASPRGRGHGRMGLSVFRTHEDPQPTSEFNAACPCPDGLMQDETQEGG
jgi:hypothetical protein